MGRCGGPRSVHSGGWSYRGALHGCRRASAGPIPHRERRIVVDGQQRLTTLQLLIDAVQEVLEDQGHSSPALRLSALVDNRPEFRDGDDDNAFKVWPTTVDRTAFRHAMSNDLSGAKHAGSRVVQAHDYFKGQVGQWLNKAGDEAGERARAASALEEAVRTRLELVVIDLDDFDDPHMIFETLNARGTPLLQSDMVKNKVLHDAKIRPCRQVCGRAIRNCATGSSRHRSTSG